MDFSQKECPVCKKPFGAGDDVVTCPDCGAPYHRDCYKQSGHCLFEDKHGGGFEYKSPKQQKAENAGKDDGPATSSVVCKNCNMVNDARNIFCEKCGAPLHSNGPAPQQAAPPLHNTQPNFYGQTVYGRQYGPQVDYNGEIDGIPKKDWAEYVGGQSAGIYIYRLSEMARRDNKISFMFSAFFLGPFYFAYRKMWGWAGVALLASLLLMVPSVMWNFAQAGSILLSADALAILDIVISVATVLSWGVNILTGMFAMYLFRLSAGKRIKELKQQSDGDADYRAALARKGGTSIPGVVIVVGIMFLVGMLVIYLGGIEYINMMMGATNINSLFSSSGLM